MKRLTIMTQKGAALKMNDTYPSESAARTDLMGKYRIAVDRLAAYEDTGLTPEEIAAMKVVLMGQWISVKDRLPEPYSSVLVWDGQNCEMSSAGYQRDGHWCGYDIEDDSHITHWMPLPAPPENIVGRGKRMFAP